MKLRLGGVRVRGLALAGALVVATAGVALAAGFFTNGLPTVGPTQVNGTNATAPNGVYTNVDPRNGVVPMDTNLAGGTPPQSVGASSWLVGATLMSALSNTSTSTAHAMTLNTTDGLITTEALTTQPGATYTFTLTDSLLNATSYSTSAVPLIAVGNKTNNGGTLQVTSVSTNLTANTATIVLTNVGSTAVDGTILIAFHL